MGAVDILAIVISALLGVGAGFLNSRITRAVLGKDGSVNRVMGVNAAHLLVYAALMAALMTACKLLKLELTWEAVAATTGMVLTTIIIAGARKNKGGGEE